MTERSPEDHHAYAQRAQERINERLAMFGNGAKTTDGYVLQVINRMMPPGWLWLDNTRPGGPASIKIITTGDDHAKVKVE